MCLGQGFIKSWVTLKKIFHQSLSQHMLDVKVEEIKAEINSAKKVLEGESQSLWTVLRCSLAQKFDWHLSLCYPSDIKDAASRLDNTLWSTFETACWQQVPQTVGPNDFRLQIQGCDSLSCKSFQNWLVRQPIKLAGFGLRSLVETSPAAFIGGVEMSVPHFSGEAGVCRQVEDLVGIVVGAGAVRWNNFLAAGSRPP